MNGGISFATRKIAQVSTVALAVAGSLTLITSGRASASPIVNFGQSSPITNAADPSTPACPPPVISGTTATVTCSYNGTTGADGSPQYWTVPAGVTQASFSLYGAGDGLTGIGGLTSATLNVVAGSTLTVGVGGQGTTDAGGFGGGGAPGVLAEGGGGASWVTDSDGTALLVAGGAGGTAFGDAAQNGPESGGAGGGQAGDAGSNDLSCDDQGCDLDFGGGSGTQSFVFNAGFGEHEGGSTGYGPLMFDGTDVTDAAAGGAGSATAQCNVPSAFFDPNFRRWRRGRGRLLRWRRRGTLRGRWRRLRVRHSLGTLGVHGAWWWICRPRRGRHHLHRATADDYLLRRSLLRTGSCW